MHAFELVPSTYRALARMRVDCGFEDTLTCHAFGLSDADATVLVDMEVDSSCAFL
jgi:hypothetical protein